ncbi:D-alanyl-D-alanine carboxypeptidase [Streptomyces spinosisporus]|uniref:serine-type D-Ala-D-Ala carboxypeptidase n=1 Tax=Streptomyces spinosisporus TaxID=2927582 RepID=A0ABS9XHW8_9ACTN|nr:D-alanyl-D-alanine carboxypeptidase [Streptomyces spinosisporus]MCI3241192.1 D-alanyl-D-alanine carboxypeptidase [Streptomyces spinosisporus]
MAGESPDRSKKRASSAEPTSGSTGPVPEARTENQTTRDPRLAVAQDIRGGVDTATRVFSVRGATGVDAGAGVSADRGEGAANAGGNRDGGAAGADEDRGEGAAGAGGDVEKGAASGDGDHDGGAAGRDEDRSEGAAGGGGDREERAVSADEDRREGAVSADQDREEGVGSGGDVSADGAAEGDEGGASSDVPGGSSGDDRLRAAVAAWVRSGDSKDAEAAPGREKPAEGAGTDDSGDAEGGSDSAKDASGAATATASTPADSKAADSADAGPEEPKPATPADDSEAGSEADAPAAGESSTPATDAPATGAGAAPKADAPTTGDAPASQAGVPAADAATASKAGAPAAGADPGPRADGPAAGTGAAPKADAPASRAGASADGAATASEAGGPAAGADPGRKTDAPATGTGAAAKAGAPADGKDADRTDGASDEPEPSSAKPADEPKPSGATPSGKPQASEGDPSGKSQALGGAPSEKPQASEDAPSGKSQAPGGAPSATPKTPGGDPSAKSKPPAGKPVDQPTAVFKRPQAKPQVDQPTTMLKLGDVPKGPEKEAPAAERTSKFVALRPLDEPGTRRPADATAQVPQVGPERTAQQPLPPKPPMDLLAELTNTPPPPQTPVRTLVRRVKIWTPLVLLLVIVFAIVQAVRPLPTPTLALTAEDSYTFDGDNAALPWPNEGQGWMDVNGIGTMGNFGKQTPVAIGSVAKAMTAYLVLKDHPLKPGAEGEKITVDALAEKEGGYDKDGESTLNTVKKGDVLTERQALSAIMIPSANNIARLLARWDAGSEAAFIKKMNDTAKDLGMKNTTYTDASGLKESTVSTAQDQVLLGNELVKIPALMEITKLPNWIDPSGHKWRNYNALVPFNGALGIKTGTTTKAGGNLLFAATKEVGGETVTVVGAILGQHTAPIIDTVNAVSKTAMLAARDALTSTKILKKGSVVGYVDDRLGGHTPIVLTKDVTAVGWAGLKVKLSFEGDDVPHSAKAGTQVGTLTVGDGSNGAVKVPVALQKDLAEPGFGAKLKRLG